MGEIVNVPPQQPEATQGRRIHYRDVFDADLQPGDIIEGVTNLRELDLFVELLGENLTGAYETHKTEFPSAKREDYLGVPRSFKMRTFKGKTLSTVLKEHTVRPKSGTRFNGEIKNFSITMVPPDPSRFVDPTIKLENVRSFYIEGELHSTGRGKIGTLAHAVDLLYGSRMYRGGGIKVTPMNNSEVWRNVLNLQRESSETAQGVKANALRSLTVSGGLPTLGKNR